MYEVELKNFINAEGKLRQFPSKRKMQVYAILFLGDKFEPGRDYTPMDIAAILHQWCDFNDPATLRRELCDAGVLDRTTDGKKYWLRNLQPKFEDFGV